MAGMGSGGSVVSQPGVLSIGPAMPSCSRHSNRFRNFQASVAVAAAPHEFQQSAALTISSLSESSSQILKELKARHCHKLEHIDCRRVLQDLTSKWKVHPGLHASVYHVCN